MILEWSPFWYNFDQTIIVGDKDYFYIYPNENKFANDPSSSDDQEIFGEVLRIKHNELGELKGIITNALNYNFYLINGKHIEVNSEERPGEIENGSDEIIKVNNWIVSVEIKIIFSTGLSSISKIHNSNLANSEKVNDVKNEKYKKLLDINSFD